MTSANKAANNICAARDARHANVIVDTFVDPVERVRRQGTACAEGDVQRAGIVQGFCV